ncbi:MULTISPECIES: TonB-dependent receptor domain-containing protein [unclassified Lonepinella]|uniref:TonB-dependent receptor domain-containing protein n=1 Tax=unclassified Lonepinella TaxID=2642006 RepID=UPI0036DF76A1
MKKKFTLSTLSMSLSLAVLPCSLAYAQNEECQQDPSLKQCKNTLDTIIVSANRSATDSAKFVGQASKFESDSLLSQSRLIDVLGESPNVDFGRDMSRQIGQNFKVRGFGYGDIDRVIIQQDDVPRDPTLYSNHISSFRSDNDILKDIETVKGASSILHGSGAIGGIISMTTKDASDYLRPGQQYGASIGGRLESNNMKSGMVQLYARPNTAPVDILFHAKRALHGNVKIADGGQDGTTHNKNDEHINSYFAKFGWDMNTNHRLTLSAFNYTDKLNTGWQTLYHDYDEDNPVRGKLSQKDYVLTHQYNPSNPWINLTLRAFYSEAEYHRIARSATSLSDYTNSDKRYGFSAKNIAKFQTGRLDHELVLGADYKNKKMDATFITLAGKNDTGSFPNTSHDIGLYFQDNIQFNRLILTLGGRYDIFKRKVEKAGGHSYEEKRFSPRVALSYEMLDGINLLAGYSETFRAPTPDETSSQGLLNPHYYYLPNPNLKPETAKEYETGFSVSKNNLFNLGHAIYFKATYFNGKIKDMISLQARPELGEPPERMYPNYPAQYAQYLNVSNVKRTGVEAELKYSIGDLLLSGSYGHLKLKNTVTGKRVSTFADRITAGIAYSYNPWDLTAGLKVKHWFKPKADTFDYYSRDKHYSYVNGTFTQVDFNGIWQPQNTGFGFIDQDLKVMFGVNNLLNKKYKPAGTLDITATGGPGRNYYVQVEKHF